MSFQFEARESGCCRFSVTPHLPLAASHLVTEACGEMAERIAAVFGWALRGAFYRSQPATAAAPRRQPFFSLSGIALLAFAGFILSRFSCVEIKEDNPAARNGAQNAEVIEFGFGAPPPSAPTIPNPWQK